MKQTLEETTKMAVRREMTSLKMLRDELFNAMMRTIDVPSLAKFKRDDDYEEHLSEETLKPIIENLDKVITNVQKALDAQP